MGMLMAENKENPQEASSINIYTKKSFKAK